MLDRYQQAKHIAREAGALALEYKRNAKSQGLKIQAKGVQDFVTEADQQVELLIRSFLQNKYPNDGFFGEESDADLRPGQGFWVVDPIDGTSNYMRHVDQWGVSIAYVKDGEILIGVIYDPDRDILYHACKGKGAYSNEQRQRLDDKLPQDPIIVLGQSRRAPLALYLDAISELHRQGVEHRRYGSAALGLAQVISGQCDGYFEAELNPWDCMAGFLLIEEAGGVVVSGGQMATSLTNMPVAAGIKSQHHVLQALVDIANQ